jgi:hypothetical protein
MRILNKLFGGGSRETTKPPGAPGRSPVCDVCSRNMQWGEGYGLTTTQVTTTEAYWDYLFAHQLSNLYKLGPDGDLLAAVVAGQAGQSSVWLVCESCANLFHFDPKLAREYNHEGPTPPGTGPAVAGDVALAAGYAWSKNYDAWPCSILVRESEPPIDGEVCDFCRRRLYPKEGFALFKQKALEAYESKNALRRRAGPSRKFADEPVWMACSLCIRRADRIIGV